MNAILNYDFYNNEMKKGLEDKLFFMSNKEIYENLTSIMDYGCADGALIQEMSEIYPWVKFTGFDLDQEMINLANSKNIKNASFFNKFKNAERNNKENGNNSAILCSSLIHEVYSYGTKESIDEFWFNLNNGTHEYIIIRDMCMSKNDAAYNTMNIEMLNKILKYGDKRQVSDLQKVWGEFKTTADVIHFLYKYRYRDNWKRAVEENYFPIFLEDYKNLVDLNKFEIVHFEHYLLPYQKEVVKKDFKINLESSTHVKWIFKRK